MCGILSVKLVPRSICFNYRGCDLLVSGVPTIVESRLEVTCSVHLSYVRSLMGVDVRADAAVFVSLACALCAVT